MKLPTINKTKTIIGVLGIITIVSGVGLFFNKYELHAQSPVVFRKLVWVTERTVSVITFNQLLHNTPLNSNQQYLCDKFGDDCKLALAIQHAENGTGACDRINWSNQNQSIDIGYMQINTLWVDKNRVQPSQLFDCKTNIDFAYQIYLNNNKSFKDWSTYQSGAYKKYLW